MSLMFEWSHPASMADSLAWRESMAVLDMGVGFVFVMVAISQRVSSLRLQSCGAPVGRGS